MQNIEERTEAGNRPKDQSSSIHDDCCDANSDQTPLELAFRHDIHVYEFCSDNLRFENELLAISIQIAEENQRAQVTI